MSSDHRKPAGSPRLARRHVLKLIAAAATAPVFWSAPGIATMGTKRGPAGTPTDPDLLDPNIPWELQLTESERLLLETLCDIIIPADEKSPAASAIGAHDFIDEWVSAPYDTMAGDLAKIRNGLAWLEDESAKRFGGEFAQLEPAQQAAICDDICHPPAARPEHAEAAWFFDRVRMLTAMAFYTTREGMNDVGYVGNVPLDRWDPPPDIALRHVGLK